jgi:hypothetical protein
MASGFKGAVGVLIAGSLFVTSTAAVAAPTAAPVSATQINPWGALAVLSGAAPVAALCNGATPVDPSVPAPPGVTNGCIMPVTDVVPPVPQQAGPPQPIPVPPVEAPGGLGLGIDPLMLALGVLAAGALIYFLVRHHHNNANSPA